MEEISPIKDNNIKTSLVGATIQDLIQFNTYKNMSCEYV